MAYEETGAVSDMSDHDASALMDRFETFWRAYPRRTGKGAARKVWARLKPDQALVTKMLDALVWQREQPQWTKDGGEFIPHPSTWLNQERWEDEPVQVAHALTPRLLTKQQAVSVANREALLRVVSRGGE